MDLGACVPYNKDDFNQKQSQEDLPLFTAKELVPLSFVEAPSFKTLVFK
jgi:hypothetical protein